VLPLHTILCPLDFSESSYKSLRNAAELATEFCAELLLVHILAPIPIVPLGSSLVPDVMPIESGTTQAAAEEREIATKERLIVAARQLPSVLKSRVAVGIGDAADEIVRTAKAESVDLIVISTHGATGWRHLIFGSVAEKVIRLSDRPVLVIPVHEPK
jgi:universal stress protein A